MAFTFIRWVAKDTRNACRRNVSGLTGNRIALTKILDYRKKWISHADRMQTYFPNDVVWTDWDKRSRTTVLETIYDN
jgi:hypothetical protein